MLKDILDLEFLFNTIKNNYYRVVGLIVGFLFITFLYLKYIEPYFDQRLILKYRLMFYFFILVIWLIVWVISRNYFPRTKNNKIGMIIAISAENIKQKTRIKIDFAENINSLFLNNKINNLFDIILLNDYKAEVMCNLLDGRALESRSNINFGRKFEKLNNKIHGQFYIWGNIKERLDEENKYIIKIDALVVHKPIPPEKQNQFRKDFLAIFPREIAFYERLEVKGFTIASELIYLATRFVTGNAALLSGDPITALKLHEGLRGEINRHAKPLPPNLLYIANKADLLILAEKSWIATYEYNVNRNVILARKLIAECISGKDKNYSALLLASIISFAEDRNPIDALKHLFHAKKYSGRDFTWLYNMAFIYMYIGKLEKGVNCYKRLAKISFEGDDNVVEQCIGFNKKLYETESDKIQSLFVIGFLYYKKMQNMPISLDYFEKFVKKSNGINKYDNLRQIAQSYLAEIKKYIGI